MFQIPEERIQCLWNHQSPIFVTRHGVPGVASDNWCLQLPISNWILLYSLMFPLTSWGVPKSLWEFGVLRQPLTLWSILRTPLPSLQASGNPQELWSQPCHLEFPDTVWECVYPGKTEFPGIVPGHLETRDPLGRQGLGHQGHHTRIPGPHHTLEMKGSLYYITFPGGIVGNFLFIPESALTTDQRNNSAKFQLSKWITYRGIWVKSYLLYHRLLKGSSITKKHTPLKMKYADYSPQQLLQLILLWEELCESCKF